MKAWVKEQNKEQGSKLYRVEGLEKPAPKPIPEPVVVEAPEEPDLSLSFSERIIAERTLGLDQKGKVHRNTFKPDNDVEQRSVASLVQKGLMKANAGAFYLTVAGISALDAKRKILFGEIG